MHIDAECKLLVVRERLSHSSKKSKPLGQKDLTALAAGSRDQIPQAIVGRMLTQIVHSLSHLRSCIPNM
jgi:hypothetical protein